MKATEVPSRRLRQRYTVANGTARYDASSTGLSSARGADARALASPSTSSLESVSEPIPARFLCRPRASFSVAISISGSLTLTISALNPLARDKKPRSAPHTRCITLRDSPRERAHKKPLQTCRWR